MFCVCMGPAPISSVSLRLTASPHRGSHGACASPCLPLVEGMGCLQTPLFSPIFSLAREKIGPPEARQKRPRRNESLQARLLILCARFFLSKPQTEFAVWVFLCKSAATSQSACGCQHPYPFCPFGTFPPDRGNRPLGGEPFLLRRDRKTPGFGWKPGVG